jgi:hypothetical protein
VRAVRATIKPHENDNNNEGDLNSSVTKQQKTTSNYHNGGLS